MSDLVSVIIPSYGGGEFLCRAVDSVLSQTYTNIEVIIVDDNGFGTENQRKTEQIIGKYSNKHNVRYICHEKNKNGSAARNTGAMYANGTYLALLDDDDEYYPNSIEEHIKTLSALPEEYALTYCGHTVFLHNQKIAEKRVTKSGSLLFEVLMHTVTIGSSSLCIRKSAWEELGGFDESFRRHQDWEFTARVAAAYKVKAVDNLGFIGYLEFRNSPKSVETAKKYRLHYLEKMQPYIALLPKKQRKRVIVENRMDIAIQYLKTGNLRLFLAECHEIKPGLLGIAFLIKRACIIIQRGKLVIR